MSENSKYEYKVIGYLYSGDGHIPGGTSASEFEKLLNDGWEIMIEESTLIENILLRRDENEQT